MATTVGVSSVAAQATMVGASYSMVVEMVGSGSAKQPDKPVPISDAAKGHSYVFYEGPLGAHL